MSATLATLMDTDDTTDDDTDGDRWARTCSTAARLQLAKGCYARASTRQSHLGSVSDRWHGSRGEGARCSRSSREALPSGWACASRW